jgi:hypothetical protein
MQNRTFGPYLASIYRILVSLMYVHYATSFAILVFKKLRLVGVRVNADIASRLDFRRGSMQLSTTDARLEGL